ncbi:AAA family ATPase [Rosistilla oblonga]|uniref:AAA family ATPase n=1 Tax=Rosistilla oblonga TaxID=2527990 RepID=UPI003A97AE93
MIESQKPTVYVIAGPNGAGKTTFAQEYLLKHANCDEFVNADLIAAGLSPYKPESQSVAAGRLMLDRIDELTSAKQIFAFETTLAGRGHVKRLRRMRNKQGYRIVVFFIWLPSVEQAVARVAARVREGGHAIPEPTIRRRYRLGIQNFGQLYAPFVDHWLVYDGSSRPAVIVVEENDATNTVFDDDRYEFILQRTPELLP